MSIKTLAQSQDISAQITKLVLGVFALTALAQIKFYLPLSPVPVTGQTFGVALLSLILGRKLAVGSVASYIALGFSGAPIFAGFQVGLLGPTVGYLAGMLVASFVVGGLSDRGFNKSFSKALTATYAGSACVFTFVTDLRQTLMHLAECFTNTTLLRYQSAERRRRPYQEKLLR